MRLPFLVALRSSLNICLKRRKLQLFAPAFATATGRNLASCPAFAVHHRQMSSSAAKSPVDAQLLGSDRLLVRPAEEFRLLLSLSYPQSSAPSPENSSSEASQTLLQPHIFNFRRAKEEPSSVTVARIQASLNSHLQSRVFRRQKKRQPATLQQDVSDELQSHPNYVRDVCILDAKGDRLNPDSPCADAFAIGHTLCLNDSVRYPMLVDPSLVVSCKLTSQLLSGFPLHCSLQLESCTDCTRIWELSPSLAKPVWTEFSRHPFPTLPVDSAGCFVRLTAVPKPSSNCQDQDADTGSLRFQQTFGPITDAIKNYVSTRHAYTPTETGPDTVRLVSYNLLANLYADSDFSRDFLFPWCDPGHLAMSYRKCLLFRELAGYKADLLTLQEVDDPLFGPAGGLADFLSQECGLEGRSCMKQGQDGKPTPEGLAIFYRRSRFEFVEDRSLASITAYLDQCDDLSWLSASVRSSSKFLEAWLPRGQCAQVLVLRPLNQKSGQDYVCVCTTHLFWYPPANLVRLLQTYLTLHWLDRLKRDYAASGRRLAVLLAGDFNSQPDRGPYWLATRGSLPAEHADWFSLGREAMLADRRDLQHSLSLAAAYEPQAFTNYTGGFSGHLDHIFYDREAFRLAGTVPLPSLDEIGPLTALPNCCYPSDHLALVADLRLL